MPFKRINFRTCIIVLAAITFFAYLPVLRNNFVNWDDPHYVTENPLIRGLSPGHIYKLFTVIHQNLYKPLVLLTFAIEYRFFGLNPFFYHFDNLILHVLNTLLVFWLILLFTKKKITAFVAALLFGIHPLHVESVAWITERKDVLYGLFFLGSLISYLYYIYTQKKWQYYLSLGLFFLSLLSKPMAMTLPLVLCLLDFICRRKFTAIVILEKIPFLFAGVVPILITRYGRYLGQLNNPVTWDYFFVANHSVLFYFYKIFLPFNLCAIYPRPHPVGGLLSLKFMLSPFILVFIIFLLIISLRRTRKVVFGAAFFLVTLIPVLHPSPLANVIAADRYIYIPAVGIFYLSGELFRWIYEKSKDQFKKIIFSGSIMAVIILSLLTSQRIRVWQDSISLWSDIISKHPIPIAFYNLGNAYYEREELNQAIYNYTKAIETYSYYTEAYVNRGLAYAAEGKYDKAISDYNIAIQQNPDYSIAYIDRGIVYQETGLLDKAILDYSKAIAIDPSSVSAFYNRAVAYYFKKQYSEALGDLNKAESLGLEINPVIIARFKEDLSVKK